MIVVWGAETTEAVEKHLGGVLDGAIDPGCICGGCHGLLIFFL